MTALLGRACAAAFFLTLATSAHADRWFGSVTVSCENSGPCMLSPEMPEPPGDPVSLYLQRSAKASAPVDVFVRVNRPAEGGVPIRLEFGDTTFDLAPGADVVTRRETFGGKELLTGYWLTEGAAAAVLAAMRKVDVGRIAITIGGKLQERSIMLDGLDAALRNMDERQGRAGAEDAVIDRGSRAAADVAVPKPLPDRAAWPAQVTRLYKGANCEPEIPAFLQDNPGFVATPAPGRELWSIACAGGNYNVHYLFIEIHNGDPKTARVLTFPTRLHKRSAGVATNPYWWDAKKQVWAFERFHSSGVCGVVALYQWSKQGFVLADERRKNDCEGLINDPWTRWPAVKSGRRPIKR